jgi:AcrR family transcriptional regulator
MQAKPDGRSVRWDAHRQSRRDELVQLTAECVQRHGADVGMARIAEHAGTSKAVFYRHFADKADLYRAVGRQLAAVLSEQVRMAIAREADPRARIAAGIDAFLAVLDRNPQLYRFVVDNPVLRSAGADPAADYTGQIAAGLDDAIASLPGFGGPRGPWGAAIVGLVKAAGDWWLAHPAAMTRAELAESLTTLLWGGEGGLRAALTGTELPEERA